MSLIWNDIQAGQPADPAPINILAHYVTQSLVEKVAGKMLSTNDYTTIEKEKLANIEEAAQVNPAIVNDLTTGGLDKVLSAEQGKVLKQLIDTLSESGGGIDPSEPIDSEHIYARITSEEGVHGIRYYNNNLQVYSNGAWKIIEGGGDVGHPPNDVTNLNAMADNERLIISWNDPDDVYADDIPVILWGGTMLVRKIGSFPTHPEDGTLVVNNTERNAFALNGYVDTGLVNGTTYYYALFPYNTTGAVNMNESENNQIEGTPKSFVIFGVSIDLTNSNPETAVTYTDDAVGMTPCSSAWDSATIFKDIKPCLFKNGVVQYYLDRSDFTKKADGSAADITSGDDGDVMIEIPKIGVKINTVGDVLTVQITDNPAGSADGFRYYAHTRTTEGDRDFIYIGAYMGNASSDTLHSISGKAPLHSLSINDFRTFARANGTGYNILTFFEVTLLQCLFLIKYKNRNSQTALGRGLVAPGTSVSVSGVTNTLGFNYGEATGTIPVKFLGIENLWGNVEQFMDGVFVSNDGSLLVAFNTSLYSDAGTNYTNTGRTIANGTEGFLVQVQGTTETGFIGKTIGGSSSTHFADSVALFYSGFFRFGAAISNNTGGIFHHKSHHTVSEEYIGSRLTYI